MKQLTICIPTFNRIEFLLNQLDFFKEEIKPYDFHVDIIVSDNKSNDYNRKKLVRYSQEYDFFKLVLQNDNLGLIGNINALLQQTNSKFVWFVGDDDILLPGILSRIISIITNHEEISYLFMNYKVFKDNIDNIICQFKLEGNNKPIDKGGEYLLKLFDKYGSIMMFITSNIYSTEILKKRIAKSKVASIEDPLLYSFLCANNSNIYVEDKVFILDRIGTTSWSKQSVKIFSWGVPLILLEVQKLFYEKEEIRNVLLRYFRKDRGNYFLMLILSPFNVKYTIFKFLGYKQSLLFLNSIYYIFLRIIHRFHIIK